jgi:hypothetical protein
MRVYRALKAKMGEKERNYVKSGQFKQDLAVLELIMMILGAITLVYAIEYLVGRL